MDPPTCSAESEVSMRSPPLLLRGLPATLMAAVAMGDVSDSLDMGRHKAQWRLHQRRSLVVVVSNVMVVSSSSTALVVVVYGQYEMEVNRYS